MPHNSAQFNLKTSATETGGKVGQVCNLSAGLGSTRLSFEIQVHFPPSSPHLDSFFIIS